MSDLTLPLPSSLPARRSAGWLKDPASDLTMIVGALALAAAAVLWVERRPDLLPVVVVIDLWLFGYHHVVATFTKLAGTRADRLANRQLIYVLPWVVAAGTVAVGVVVGIWAIVTVYFFWQWFH
jgi:hypothetical protein